MLGCNQRTARTRLDKITNMAPALPVYSRSDIEEMYPVMKQANFRGEVPRNCQLYQLVQNQCTYDGNSVLCLPFERLFLRCKEYGGSGGGVGYKLQGKSQKKSGESGANGSEDGERIRYRNYEITNAGDNVYSVGSADIVQFLKADAVLRGRMQSYYEKQQS